MQITPSAYEIDGKILPENFYLLDDDKIEFFLVQEQPSVVKNVTEITPPKVVVTEQRKLYSQRQLSRRNRLVKVKQCEIK